MTNFTDSFTLKDLISCGDDVRISGVGLTQFIEDQPLARPSLGLPEDTHDVVLIAWLPSRIGRHHLLFVYGRFWEVVRQEERR